MGRDRRRSPPAGSSRRRLEMPPSRTRFSNNNNNSTRLTALCPGLPRELTAVPDPLAGFMGPTSKGKGGEG